MDYVAYADAVFYKTEFGGTTIPDDQLDRALRQASQHIDTLTFNRIVGRGFSNLTEFQQGTIKEVVCLQADFEYNNADMLDNVLASYAINGVSMSFGASWNLEVRSGVAMRKDTYSLLAQTGLMVRVIGR